MSVGMARLFGGGQAASSFTVFMSPSSVFIPLPSSGARSSSNVSALITGGVPPYTFAWQKLFGPNIDISAFDTQTVFFTAYTSFGNPQETEWRCTVTDSLAAEAFSTIVVDAERLF